jgi:hypothetical protein
MSFADRLVLWLHVGFAIFTIGPVTMAIMSTPRYIRKRDPQIVRYLSRLTVVFTLACLGVLIAGLFLAQLKKDFSHPWLTVSLTLFVVAVFLLVLVIRDQRKAIGALESSAALAAEDAALAIGAEATSQAAAQGEAAQPDASGRPAAPVLAAIERGRIAMMGGVISLLWLVILAMMIWQP